VNKLNARLKDAYFWATITIIIATISLSTATYLRLLNLGFTVGNFRFNVWLSWTGVLFVAIYTPIYHILKSRFPNKAKTLLGIHVIGNLLAFMLISIHFAHQIGRSIEFYPDLGTGVVLYLVMLIMVSTGIIQRFQLAPSQGKRLKFLHLSVAISFYLVIFVHILHGIGLI
jgi:hypothetical protein